MDKYSLKLMEDIVLEAPGSSKTNSHKSNARYKKVLSHSKNKRKVEDMPQNFKVKIQTLNLSEASEKEIYDTLKEIHGSSFQLADPTKFEGNNPNTGTRIYSKRSNFIKEVENYSTKNIFLKSHDEEITISDFTTLKLETYNFHTPHCTQALEKTEGHMGKALELLFYKYYGIEELPKKDNLDGKNWNDVFERRQKEKEELQLNHGDRFKEKIKNRVWILYVNLDYLIENTEKQKIECGPKPAFKDTAEDKSKTINDSLFTLEIRFPEDCKYPYEPPYFYFYKNAGAYPALDCLKVARRLHNEALKLCDDGNPFILSIISLLKNQQEIQCHLKDNKETFFDQNHFLFSESSEAKQSFPTDNRSGSMDSLERIYKKEREKISKEIFDQNMDIKAKSTEIQKNFELLINERDYIKCKKPIFSKIYEIIKIIEENQVSIVKGEPGCGKSTQIPQFILNNWIMRFNENVADNIEIICTQPRRLNVVALAESIAAERNEKVGNTIGYETRSECKLSSFTRLKICTVEVLLQRLSDDPLLKSSTHIIVDEVQERTAEGDFLLMCLRKIVVHRRDLKVLLLLSTGSNVDQLSNYFGKVPILDLPPLKTYYHETKQLFLEDFFELAKCELNENSMCPRKIKNIGLNNANFKEVDSEQAEIKVLDEHLRIPQIIGRYHNYSELTQKNLYLMDHNKFDLDLVIKAIEWIVKGNNVSFIRSGTLLVFLPGDDEVTTLKDMLLVSKVIRSNHKRVFVTVLHSNLNYKELKLPFEQRRGRGYGTLKIVLATNIAETSMTIMDCNTIIDTGKISELTLNRNLGIESSKISWISKANAVQRVNRANSWYTGMCILLYSSYRFKYHLSDQPIPEIMRVSLEPLLLRTKILQKNRVFNFHQDLGVMLDQPSQDSILSAIKGLQYVGALDSESMLTPLGHHLAALNINVRIGKLILYGAIFCCVDSALTIAACFIHKSPFVDSIDKKQEVNAKKKEYATANSDHLTALKIYMQWEQISARDSESGDVFANENFLSKQTLRMLVDTKNKLLELLISTGFVHVNMRKRPVMNPEQILEITGQELNTNNENYAILQGLLSAALYPNVAKVLTPESTVSEESKELLLLTKNNEILSLHPSSINFNVTNFSSPFLAFEEKIENSKIFIKEITMVPMLPLILFSGYGIDIEFNDGQWLLLLDDGWITFAVKSLKVAQLLQLARVELSELLEKKMQDPKLNLLNYPRGRKIIKTIVDLVSSC